MEVCREIMPPFFITKRREFMNSAIRDGEITPARQKKETSFFVLLSTFRNFAAQLSKTRKQW